MIEFLRTWANQVIVGVIIATIFEMILPNGNNKKYIKMIIGIYVLFTIIQPVITKLSGNDLNIANFDYEKYFDEEILETSTEDFEDNNSKLIKQAYIDNIESDIEARISKKGYILMDCNIEIINNENQNNYGEIKSITLTIDKIEESNQQTSNSININKVEVSINNTNSSNKEEERNITANEKIELIEYLANEYSIDTKSIVIN